MSQKTRCPDCGGRLWATGFHGQVWRCDKCHHHFEPAHGSDEGEGEKQCHCNVALQAIVRCSEPKGHTGPCKPPPPSPESVTKPTQGEREKVEFVHHTSDEIVEHDYDPIPRPTADRIGADCPYWGRETGLHESFGLQGMCVGCVVTEALLATPEAGPGGDAFREAFDTYARHLTHPEECASISSQEPDDCTCGLTEALRLLDAPALSTSGEMERDRVRDILIDAFKGPPATIDGVEDLLDAILAEGEGEG